MGLATLPPSCAIVMEPGNHNFLEPSGPLQTCKGTALPLLCENDLVELMEEWRKRNATKLRYSAEDCKRVQMLSRSLFTVHKFALCKLNSFVLFLEV